VEALRGVPRDEAASTKADRQVFDDEIVKFPQETLDCFGDRFVKAIVKSESSVGRCQQSVLLREVQIAIENGAVMFGEASDASVVAVAECGRLISGVTTQSTA
jgi:hypothetical protein